MTINGINKPIVQTGTGSHSNRKNSDNGINKPIIQTGTPPPAKKTVRKDERFGKEKSVRSTIMITRPKSRS